MLLSRLSLLETLHLPFVLGYWNHIPMLYWHLSSITSTITCLERAWSQKLHMVNLRGGGVSYSGKWKQPRSSPHNHSSMHGASQYLYYAGRCHLKEAWFVSWWKWWKEEQGRIEKVAADERLSKHKGCFSGGSQNQRCTLWEIMAREANGESFINPKKTHYCYYYYSCM